MGPVDDVKHAISEYYRVFEAELGRNREQFWLDRGYVVALHPGQDQHTGWAEVREGLQGFPSLGVSSLKITVKDLLVHVNGEVAWAVFTEHAEIGAEIGRVAIDFRITNVYERSNGRWLLTLHHASSKDPSELAALAQFVSSIRKTHGRKRQ